MLKKDISQETYRKLQLYIIWDVCVFVSDNGILTPVHAILLFIIPDSPNSSHKDDPLPEGQRKLCFATAAFPSLWMMGCLEVFKISKVSLLLLMWIYKCAVVGD